MAAMAIVNTTALLQTANLTSTVTSRTPIASARVQFGPLRTVHRSSRGNVVVRAKGNPEHIDSFVDGVKHDASENASNFGHEVSHAVGEVQHTVEDVGRDMGAKTQEAIDAAAGKVDEGGDKASDIVQEVKEETSSTYAAATDLSDGKNVLEKAADAAQNAFGKVRQNYDFGTGAVESSAEDAKNDAKKTADRV